MNKTLHYIPWYLQLALVTCILLSKAHVLTVVYCIHIIDSHHLNIPLQSSPPNISRACLPVLGASQAYGLSYMPRVYIEFCMCLQCCNNDTCLLPPSMHT